MNHPRTRTAELPRTPLIVLGTALLMIGALMAWAPTASAQEGETETIDLHPGWSLEGWLGPDGTDITDAIENNQGPAGDLSGQLTAVFTWDGENQAWLAYFPGTDFPGANDFTSFEFGTPYYFAYNGEDSTEWVIPID